jgi:hypothetical protein
MSQEKDEPSGSRENALRENDWRELCTAAAVEEDSAKLAGLVDQIIKTLDKDRLQTHPVSISPASVLRQSTDQQLKA